VSWPPEFADSEYAAAAALDRADCGQQWRERPARERYSLPYKRPGSSKPDPEGLAAAASRFGQTKACPEAKRKAAKRLVAAYRSLGKEPPEALASAAGSESRMAEDGRPADVPLPALGDVEIRAAPEGADAPSVDGEGKLRSTIPYGVESGPMPGGVREVIEAGAINDQTKLDGLVATLGHDESGRQPYRVLGRHPGTLELRHAVDGVHWACELPDTQLGTDVRTAVSRGDLNATSWAMLVGREHWTGRTRHIDHIAELRDVSLVTRPAYPPAATRAELRDQGGDGVHGDSTPDTPERERTHPTPGRQEEEREQVEPEREDAQPAPGGLAIEDRQGIEGGGDIEQRIFGAMHGAYEDLTGGKAEFRSLTHATVAPVEPTDVQTYVWELLRPASVVLRTGVRTVPTNRKEVTQIVVTGDPEADFYNEEEEILETDLELDDLTITPKAVKALVGGSTEAFEDSNPDLMRLVTEALGQVLARKFDGEMLVGGSAKGFSGLSLLATQSLDASGELDYDPFLKAVGLLQDRDIPGPYAAIINNRTWTALTLLKELASESRVALATPEGVPPIYPTTALPLEGATPDTSHGLVFAPAQIVVVQRRGATIEVDRSEEFSKDRIKVRATARSALSTARGEAIVKLNDLAAPPIV
jgi:HK97 family phage major capsid protein/HK97 family phage prohead protease